MKKAHAVIILVILFCSLSSLAGGTKKLPDDFDARNMILLIEDSPNEGKSDKMEELMKEYYPYKYKIETKKDVHGMARDSAYADRTKYRYIVGNGEELYSGSSGKNSIEVYYLYDMLEKKAYKSVGTFKGFIKLLADHMSKLK